MPIRRRQKKPNVEPQQKPKHSHAVVDPMVNPGSPAHRRQARSKADPARRHHRMVTLAQSSPSDRSARAFQSKKPTVMLTDEFSAQFEADPPPEPALAGMTGREDEGEFRGDFRIIGNDLDAAVRDVGDCAVAWQRARPELDLRKLFTKHTFASASICC